MYSMTGFGRAENTDPASGLTLRVEISSVNRKQLDLKFALPKEFTAYETELRLRIGERISRGAVTFRLEADSQNSGTVPTVKINLAAMQGLIRAVDDLKKKTAIRGELTVDSLLSIPGMVETSAPDYGTEAIRRQLCAVTDAAVEQFLSVRKAEGERLKADIQARLELLQQHTETIRGLVKNYPREQYEKMVARLKSAGFQAEADDERLLRELAIFADKCDVTEELIRLSSHYVHFQELFNAEKASGRALDFLVQETFREINTLGNKAPTPEVSPHIVEMKTELEKIREQVQNIE